MKADLFIKVLFLLLFLSPMTTLAYVSPEDFEKDNSQHKVLVFLSDQCPCSISHQEHLRELATQFKKVSFYAVASEPIGDKPSAQEYFSSLKLGMPIIKDDQQILVKKYNALKTPYVTLVEKNKNNSKPIYQGGLSNQRTFDPQSILYLKDNLTALTQGKALVHTNGYSLGCYIRRY